MVFAHANNVRQYTIEHMRSVTHSVYVGWCMDCKNMQDTNKTKNARQGCLNVNSMLMLLSDIHGVCVLWTSSPKTANHYTKLTEFMDWFLHHENIPAYCYPVCEFLALKKRERE